MKLTFSKTAFRYLISELIPSFLVGSTVFIFIVLMFQGVRFAEFTLVHGLGFKTLAEILFFMSISLLPGILPMSLLFSVILTFGRLTGDSEIIAFRACGLSLSQLLTPVLVFGLTLSFIAGQLSFDIAPWGNRRFEVLVGQIGNSKAAVSLKEGTFMDGFFNMVVYASKVDPETNELDHVFIFDERQKPPITIIAKKGFMTQSSQMTGQQVQLELQDGDIHRKTETHTKINFGKFFISLSENYSTKEKDKSLQSLSLTNLQRILQFPTPAEKPLLRSYAIEYHRRISLSVACLIFALLGSSLGLSGNKRSGKGSGLIMALGVIVVYWILFLVCDSTARSTTWPTFIIIWIPNLIALLVTTITLHKQAKL